MTGDDERTVPRGAKLLGILAISAVLVVSLAILAFGGAQEAPAGHGTGNHTSTSENGEGTHGGDRNHGGNGNHTGSRGPVTWVVEVQDNAFAPSDLTIQVNDTVRWVHAGSNGHTVTSDDDGTAFDSHPECDPMVPIVNCMGNGDEFELTFKEAGEVPYHCKVHAAMEGSIMVQERHDATPDHHSR